jgi:anti-anti-sigma regulatory factor
MLRIVRSASGDVEVLRLEGKVVGRWVEELRRSCGEILERPDASIVIDLADVTFIDLDGIALFRTLPRQRVNVKNCSPFAAEQLREVRGRF